MNTDPISAVGGDIVDITWLILIVFFIYAVYNTNLLDWIPRKKSKKK